MIGETSSTWKGYLVSGPPNSNHTSTLYTSSVIQSTVFSNCPNYTAPKSLVEWQDFPTRFDPQAWGCITEFLFVELLIGLSTWHVPPDSIFCWTERVLGISFAADSIPCFRWSMSLHFREGKTALSSVGTGTGFWRPCTAKSSCPPTPHNYEWNS